MGREGLTTGRALAYTYIARKPSLGCMPTLHAVQRSRSNRRNRRIHRGGHREKVMTTGFESPDMPLSESFPSPQSPLATFQGLNSLRPNSSTNKHNHGRCSYPFRTPRRKVIVVRHGCPKQAHPAVFAVRLRCEFCCGPWPSER